MSRPAARLDPGPVLIRVHGMRRSGNHAVIDWLRRNLPGEAVFLNDCAPGDPYASFAELRSPRGDRHGPSFRDTRWYPQFEAGRERFHHIVSYEDRPPCPEPEGWAEPWRMVVVHRGFLGWLASYWTLVMERQRGTRWGVREPAEIVPMLWRYAALLRAEGVAVGLERWAGDPAHRRAVLAALDLPVLDDDTGPQAAYGGGSSFAPGDAAPDPEALAGRWRALAHEPRFEGLARLAARDDAFMDALRPLYPEDAARLARLARGGRLRDER
jgi:hypothetical protein